MSGYRTIIVEYHGYPLDEDGNPLPDTEKLHLRLWLGADGDDPEPMAIFQLDSIRELQRSDGSCIVCNPLLPALLRHKAPDSVEAAAAPCQRCGKPIQPGQLYYGPPNEPRHIGC